MSSLREKFDSLKEGLKFSFYSKKEAELENPPDTTATATEREVESSYVMYDPFASYSSSQMGQQSVWSANKNEMIRKWREASYLPEVDLALNEIGNEAIIYDEIDDIISLNLNDVEVPDTIKDMMQEAFHKILFLLDFNERGDELFRQWYIDGILNLEAIYSNDRIRKGIQKLQLLSPFSFIAFIDPATKQKKYYYGEANTNNINRHVNKEKVFLEEQITSINSGQWSMDRKFPISFLNKAMKVINQLTNIEDALVIYRITRSPEKRAFYVATGKLNKSKAEEYMRSLISKYRQKRTYNLDTGAMEDKTRSISILEDYWFSVDACLDLKTKIKLLDGRDLELENIIKEYEMGKTLWTYSTTPSGLVVPSKIEWAGVTRKNTEVLKVILDNDEEIICTPDHKFILRDGSECEAKDLQIDQSLMAGYFKERKTYYSKNSRGYTQIFDNEKQKWITVHSLVNEYQNRKIEKTEVVHHIDMNRYNNNPENLTIMDKKEHWFYHSKAGINSWKNSDYKEHCKHLSESLLKFNSTPEALVIRMKALETRKLNIETNEQTRLNYKEGTRKTLELRKNMKKNDPELYKTKFCSFITKSHERKVIVSEETFNIFKILLTEIIKEEHISNEKIYKILSTNVQLAENIKYSSKLTKNWNFGKKTVIKMLKQHGFAGLSDYLYKTHNIIFNKFGYHNHKVKSITLLNYKIDTGDIRISEANGHSNHNFLLSAGIFVHNSGSGTKVESIAGLSPNFTSFEDMDYFVNKVYKALNIPLNRRSSDARVQISTNIDTEKEELRFFKMIIKLRRRFNMMFTDLLKKELLAKDVFSIEDWALIQEKIKYIYANSNEYSEIKNNQVIDMRVSTANNALALVEPGLLSRQWIQENILRFTDEDINLIKKQRIEEAADEQNEGGTEEEEIGHTFGPNYNVSRREAGGGEHQTPPTEETPPEKGAPAPEGVETPTPETAAESKKNSILNILEEGDKILHNNGHTMLEYHNGKLIKVENEKI